MHRRDLVRALSTLPLAGVAVAQTGPERKPDLGDVAEGSYFGEVISDSKGSSRGETVFLYDWAKQPAHLDVSFHNEVSWSGTKQR